MLNLIGAIGYILFAYLLSLWVSSAWHVPQAQQAIWAACGIAYFARACGEAFWKGFFGRLAEDLRAGKIVVKE